MITGLPEETVSQHRERLLANEVIVPVDPGTGQVRYRLSDQARARAGLFAKIARIEYPEKFDSEALGVDDAHALILIALPRVRVSKRVSGRCTLTVRPDPYAPPDSKALSLEIDGGRVVAVAEGEAEGSSGRIDAKTGVWIASIVDGHLDLLLREHPPRLVRDLVTALHRRTYLRPNLSG